MKYLKTPVTFHHGYQSNTLLILMSPTGNKASAPEQWKT